jgi:hypothetical protein
MNYTVFALIIIKISHRPVNILEVQKAILWQNSDFLSGVLIGAPRRGKYQINKRFFAENVSFQEIPVTLYSVNHCFKAN